MIEVYQYGSMRFLGNANEAREFFREVYQARIERAQRVLNELNAATTEQELVDITSRDDGWSVDCTPTFSNHPRITR